MLISHLSSVSTNKSKANFWFETSNFNDINKVMIYIQVKFFTPNDENVLFSKIIVNFHI